jgi:hypothetical protein
MAGMRTSKVRRANDPGSEFMMSGGTAAGSARQERKTGVSNFKLP